MNVATNAIWKSSIEFFVVPFFEDSASYKEVKIIFSNCIGIITSNVINIYLLIML